MGEAVYRPDMSLKAKLRRRLVRLQHRRPACGEVPRPMVSFAFDDAPATAVTTGGAILQGYGLRGTYFVSAGLAGAEGHMGPYASRSQIMDAARAGHEIACHTYSHLDCAQADRQTIAAEIARNSATLASWGAPAPTTFAYPFGDVGAAAKSVAGARFALCRGLHPGLIRTGSDLNQAPAIGIEGRSGEGLALRWMDKAQAARAWIILFTHGVEPEPTPFGATLDSFERLVRHAADQQFDVVTVAEGARRLSDPS